MDFLMVSSDLYVLKVKRGAELSADHQLVLSWIRGESARKTWQAQTCRELGMSGGGPDPGGLQLLRMNHLRIPREVGDMESEWTMLKRTNIPVRGR